MSKAAATRLTILQQAAELVYRNGFQQTSIDEIIATTQVTKGAFFYHFANKEEMGLAMIREVLYPGMYEGMVKPLMDAKDPVEELYLMMKHLLLKSPFFEVKYGCPAVNLVEEMAPLSKTFHKALMQLFEQWQAAIISCINKGRVSGKIRSAVDANQVACFVLTGYSGIRTMGKMLGTSCYNTYLKELKIYLQGLR
jgi:TetR/AcrR family transcriptional regulator, transcriptional repressor for nem operon